MSKQKTFSFRITEKQYQALLERAESQERSVGDVIRDAVDAYLRPEGPETLREKQIELFDRLTRDQHTVVEKLGKIVDLLANISNSLPRKEPQGD